MKIVVSSFSDSVFVNNLDKNIEIVNNFVSEGNMFIIATGKNISNVNKIILCEYLKYIIARIIKHRNTNYIYDEIFKGM